ncbi:MAG: hypothetical protein ACRDRD_14605 [Pseudonocardiaceae bacterium]
MSRFEDWGDDYSDGPYITPEMWQHNLRLALSGKRGQAALREFREALLALPEPVLISRALCTVGLSARAARMTQQWQRDAALELIGGNGGREGVCAVGAFAWFRKVKAGMDPQAAFDALPVLSDQDSAPEETQDVGAAAGLTRTLAYHLGYLNDETWSSLSPEQRWQKALEWIDSQLQPELLSAARKQERA